MNAQMWTDAAVLITKLRLELRRILGAEYEPTLATVRRRIRDDAARFCAEPTDGDQPLLAQRDFAKAALEMLLEDKELPVFARSVGAVAAADVFIESVRAADPKAAVDALGLSFEDEVRRTKKMDL